MEKEKAISSQDRHKFWKYHLEAWQKTKLSQAAYCRHHSLRPNRFTYWKKRILQASIATELVQVPEAAVRVAADNFFQSAQSLALRLYTPSGFSVEIPDDFSPVTLGRLLLVLKAIMAVIIVPPPAKRVPISIPILTIGAK